MLQLGTMFVLQIFVSLRVKQDFDFFLQKMIIVLNGDLW